jgi:hypothetical protein
MFRELTDELLDLEASSQGSHRAFLAQRPPGCCSTTCCCAGWEFQ